VDNSGSIRTDHGRRLPYTPRHRHHQQFRHIQRRFRHQRGGGGTLNLTNTSTGTISERRLSSPTATRREQCGNIQATNAAGDAGDAIHSNRWQM